jgi:glutathione synthase/RimK-type ligase-like ATP-grasp enzyme
MKLAIARCNSWDETFECDQILLDTLDAQNIDYDYLSWDSDFKKFKQADAVVIRMILDYPKRITEFRAWLDSLEREGLKVINPVPLMRWNIHKEYLVELSEKGVSIPKIYMGVLDRAGIADIMDNEGWEFAVLKRTIGSGGREMELVDRALINQEFIAKNKRDYLLQEYIPEIKTAGETSMLFFNGKFSHAIVKMPKDGEFRIHSWYGGDRNPAKVSKKDQKWAQDILDKLPEKAGYARIDAILGKEENYLMEVEVIEPDLYFAQDNKAANRYIDMIKSQIG